MSRPFFSVTLAALFAVSVLAAPAALAQHAGDVDPTLSSGKIVFDTGNSLPRNLATGYKIYEGNFNDFAGGPNSTDDPGFDMADGTFVAGQQLWFKAIGSLSYWNGMVWGAAPGSATFTITDALSNNTLIMASGVTNPFGAVGQADDGGGIHAHIDYSISPVPAGPVGAYMATLFLTSRTSDGTTPFPGITDSDPFHLVMNRGLSHTDFENAVSALAVPEPETYAMLLAGLALIGGLARRRASRA